MTLIVKVLPPVCLAESIKSRVNELSPVNMSEAGVPFNSSTHVT
jgi:hypothetical protein